MLTFLLKDKSTFLIFSLGYLNLKSSLSSALKCIFLNNLLYSLPWKNLTILLWLEDYKKYLLFLPNQITHKNLVLFLLFDDIYI